MRRFQPHTATSSPPGTKLVTARRFRVTNGSHYVIDTSRNGAGPAPTPRSTGATQTAEHWEPRHDGDRGRTRRRLPVDQTTR